MEFSIQMEEKVLHDSEAFLSYIPPDVSDKGVAFKASVMQNSSGVALEGKKFS